jgi:predicted lysophospholipase L1 biosynthesis ABC-type transport system permease subunit
MDWHGRRLALARTAIVAGTALGFTLSYAALRHLAVAHGYDPWEAALWPAMLVGASMTMTALAMAATKLRRGPLGQATAVAVASLLVLAAADCADASWPGTVAMHVWPLAIALAGWALFVPCAIGGRR